MDGARPGTPGRTATGLGVRSTLAVAALVVLWQGSLAWHMRQWPRQVGEWFQGRYARYAMRSAGVQPVAPYALHGWLWYQYRMGASAGLCEGFSGLYYFYHHFGQFPVATSRYDPLPGDAEGARRFVAEHGNTLIMDFNRSCAVRCGDLGKIFMFVPATLLGWSANEPSVLPFNALFFVVGLIAVWVAFTAEGHALLGLLLVLLVGSNPFQLFEAYARENVFSLPVSVTLLVLALHLRFMTGRVGIERWAWGIAVFTGALLALAREIRTEAILVGALVPAVYLGARRSPLATRLLAIAVFAATYVLASQGLAHYLDRKFSEAQVFVERAGGNPYRGIRVRHHVVWHNLFLGLGDFDTRYGYAWHDQSAYRYATPILRARYRLPVTYSKGYYFNEFYEPGHFYRIKPEDLPEYTIVLKEKVLHDIRNDPRWYLGILGRRVLAVLSDTTPLTLAVGPWRSEWPLSGWIVLPALVAAAFHRDRLLLKLLLFSLPLSLPAVLVYAKGGMTYLGIFHLVALCILVQVAIDGLRYARRALG